MNVMKVKTERCKIKSSLERSCTTSSRDVDPDIDPGYDIAPENDTLWFLKETKLSEISN